MPILHNGSKTQSVMPAPGYKAAVERAKAAESNNTAAPKTAEEVIKASETQANSGQEPASGETSEVKEPTKAEKRKEYLEASKMKRAAQEETKRAKEAQARAAKIEEAAKMPNGIDKLKALGIDPKQFVDDIIKHNESNPEPDEVSKKVKAEVSPYVEALEKEKQELQQQRLVMAETQVVQQEVFPLMQVMVEGKPALNSEYESILQYHNDDPVQASIYVYNAVKKEFQARFDEAEAAGVDTSQICPMSFQEAAQQLEDKLYNQILMGINKTKGMKKFSKLFAEAIKEEMSESSSTGSTQVSKEQSKPSTETASTNKRSIDRNVAVSGNAHRSSSDDAINKVLAKFGLE